jgi:hypothetical protein
MRNVVSCFVWKLQHVKKIEFKKKKKNLSNSAQKTLKKEKENI